MYAWHSIILSPCPPPPPPPPPFTDGQPQASFWRLWAVPDMPSPAPPVAVDDSPTSPCSAPFSELPGCCQQDPSTKKQSGNFERKAHSRIWTWLGKKKNYCKIVHHHCPSMVLLHHQDLGFMLLSPAQLDSELLCGQHSLWPFHPICHMKDGRQQGNLTEK